MILEPEFRTVPEELQNLNQWILWRSVKRSGKEVKLPWSVYDAAASSTDPATWSSYECAVIQHRPGYHAGIGFVFAPAGGYIGIDLDSCRHPDSGLIAQWAQKWIDESPGYCEISPSGTGVKIWERSDMQLATGKNWKIDEQPMVPGKQPGVEVYSHGRYFAVTGHVIKGFAT